MADLFVFYDEVKYTKNDWRNRNKIYSKNGIQWLSIPIEKDAVKMKIREVRVDGFSWQEKHYKSISFAYKNSPFYDQLEPMLNHLLLQKKWKFLSDLNQYSIQTIADFIGIKKSFSNAFIGTYNIDKVHRLLEIIKFTESSHYISGPSAKEYLLPYENIFKDNNIYLEYEEYKGFSEYLQLSSPFRHDVSVIDLIANLPQKEIIKHIRKTNNH